MKIEDYSEYYIQGSDHYLIPKDEFVELFEEIKELESVLELYENGVYFSSEVDEKDKIIDELKDNWSKLKEYLREKISEERSSENLWLMGCYDEDKLILEKMKELEQGSDNNE